MGRLRAPIGVVSCAQGKRHPPAQKRLPLSVCRREARYDVNHPPCLSRLVRRAGVPRSPPAV